MTTRRRWLAALLGLSACLAFTVVAPHLGGAGCSVGDPACFLAAAQGPSGPSGPSGPGGTTGQGGTTGAGGVGTTGTAGVVDRNPPQTRIGKRPPNKTEKELARFKFSSDEKGTTFECKLDGKRFRRCRSPKTYRKLDEKKHVFKVRGTDAAGNTDRSPARDRWKVLDD